MSVLVDYHLTIVNHSYSFSSPHGKRKPGRQRTLCLRYIQHLLGDTDNMIGPGKLSELAQDRCGWRKLVVACPAADPWWITLITIGYPRTMNAQLLSLSLRGRRRLRRLFSDSIKRNNCWGRSTRAGTDRFALSNMTVCYEPSEAKAAFCAQSTFLYPFKS